MTEVAPGPRTATGHCRRRALLATVAAAVAGSVTGCTDRPSFPDANVVAGPEGRPEFDPAEVTVSAGATVTWGFGSPSHNVCCRPGDDDRVRIPEGAEPFASYGPGESPERSRISQGETFEQEFEVAGTYVYVCIPHAAKGMVGRVRVE